MAQEQQQALVGLPLWMVALIAIAAGFSDEMWRAYKAGCLAGQSYIASFCTRRTRCIRTQHHATRLEYRRQSPCRCCRRIRGRDHGHRCGKRPI